MPATAATGPAGLVFGAGAGRFTQSVDSGASWVALPQFNGDDNCPCTSSCSGLSVFVLERPQSQLVRSDGYNPAKPFFGVSFRLSARKTTAADSSDAARCCLAAKVWAADGAQHDSGLGQHHVTASAQHHLLLIQLNLRRRASLDTSLRS